MNIYQENCGTGEPCPPGLRGWLHPYGMQRMYECTYETRKGKIETKSTLFKG